MAQHYTPEYEVGEVIAVRSRALSPFKVNATTVTGLTGTAEAFAPGKDPVNSAVDRGNADASAAFTYIEGQGYVAYLDTAALTPAGTWTMRIHLSDGDGNTFDNVEYVNFDLRL